MTEYRKDWRETFRRNAASNRRVSDDLDSRMTALLATGQAVDPPAIASRLTASYHQVRRSLIRLGLWKDRVKN